MPEVNYVPNPREAPDDASREYDCDCADSGAGAGAGLVGAGSPEGVETAEPGTTYYNTSDGSFWVKQSGSGSTGWVQLFV